MSPKINILGRQSERNMEPVWPTSPLRGDSFTIYTKIIGWLEEESLKLYLIFM